MAKNAWDRLDDESNQAYGAFCAFRDQGPGRTVTKAAKILQQDKSQFNKWKHKYQWQERADAWDSYLSEKLINQSSRNYSKMLERQMKNGKILQERAMRAIMAMDLDNATIRSLHSVVELMMCGWQMEKTAKEMFNEKFNPEGQGMTITITDKINGS